MLALFEIRNLFCRLLFKKKRKFGKYIKILEKFMMRLSENENNLYFRF